MRGIIRCLLVVSIVFASHVLICCAEGADQFKFSSSTQYLWGDDLQGNSDPILAQYLRFTYTPEGKNLTIAGYGRLWYDFGDSNIFDNGFQGKLYYLYLDWAPIEKLSFRLGRQLIAFTALDQTLMDGARVDLRNLGPIGITFAGGWYPIFNVASDTYWQSGNVLWAVDVHLERVKNLQLGVSFGQKYNDSDLARQAIGMNFRYTYKFLSPYAEGRYEWLTKSFDQITAGIDIFPMSNLLIKAEFYQSYPTFDATSIYSVFAVDKYQEYLLQAEYSLDAPVAVYGSYARQVYQDGDNADRWTLGTKFVPLKNLSIDFSVDYRNGYGGNLWGFQLLGDYRVMEKLHLAAGVQYDEYKRPDQDGNQFARRYWIGGEWLFKKNLSLIGRIEDNVNQNFKHNPLGRVALNWTL
jgi:hypothetical protein